MEEGGKNGGMREWKEDSYPTRLSLNWGEGTSEHVTWLAHIFQSHSAVRFIDSDSKFVPDALNLMCKHHSKRFMYATPQQKVVNSPLAPSYPPNSQ